MKCKCFDCGGAFDEPHRWVEMHGFKYGLGENWSACPFCGGDYVEVDGEGCQHETCQETEDGLLVCLDCGTVFDPRDCSV